jgi:hypothetical protein
MFKKLANFFGFGVNNLDLKPSLQVLFDYKTQPHIYLSRCKPILEQMINCGLINKLSKCKSVEDFGCPERFNNYDMSDIEFAKSMLEKINSNPQDIFIGSEEDLTQIVKIIMKKYLMEKSNGKPKSKVWIEVHVPDNKKIKVVSYATKTKTGEDRIKDPGGSIEENESPVDAGVRELAEELGLVVDKSRLEPLDLTNTDTSSNYKFKLVLDNLELSDYIKNIKKLDIDPEITMICIV